MKSWHTHLSVSKAELGECASALIHAVLFHRDHRALTQLDSSCKPRNPPLEQECQSVDMIYVVRDQGIKDIVQTAVNDFVTKVKDSRSALIVLRFNKKENGFLGTKNICWEEWTFDFDIAPTVHDDGAASRRRRHILARNLAAQMAAVSTNCVETLATVPRRIAQDALGSYVDSKFDVYHHEFSSELVSTKSSAKDRVKGIVAGLFSTPT